MSSWLVVAIYDGDQFDVIRDGYAIEINLPDREEVVDMLDAYGVERFEFEETDGVRSEMTVSEFLNGD